MWTCMGKEELEQAMNVFKENDVIVVSDEIWSDIVFTGYKHIPTYSVSEDAKDAQSLFMHQVRHLI